VFCQVIQDTYNGGCIRITKEQRIRMRGMLGKLWVCSVSSLKLFRGNILTVMFYFMLFWVVTLLG